MVIPGLISRWVKRALDPDQMLISGMAGAIDMAAVRYSLRDDPVRYRPGQPLKLLLPTYCGTRNTGADVRVSEIVRQLKQILGEDNLELTLFTINPPLTAGYFRGVRQVELPTIFPKFLYDECPRHHGVVAAEGSMFKSKFSNALSTMLAGSLGLASLEGKLSVGYGGEAGAMDPSLEAFVRAQCRHSLIICRNRASESILQGLGIRTAAGADTAWTFEPACPARGQQLLRDVGWDGHAPVVAMCPINPFWWPARPDLLKAAAHRLGGQYRDEHYKSIVFHSWSEEAAEKYDAYLDQMALALEQHIGETGAFPVLMASERLDRLACEDLAARLPFSPPMMVSDEHDMYDFVAALRQCSLVVASRFHAIVNSMPAGVPSIGVTMDERIHNLFVDRGHEELLFQVDDADLGEGLVAAMRAVQRDSERYQRDILAFVPGQIRLMGEMGIAFEDELARVYPDFPRREVPRTWDRYLPALSPDLARLLEEWA
ncbi:MAG: polysaccharide pyruvyl transferase family protein [Myxococcales bacterium]|nr:polysaccharide pyruvyl transferase family protein [Myxococcales bacterium]